MIRNLKTLVPAMLAVLAMSAVAASAAHAEAPEYHAEEAPVTIKSESAEGSSLTLTGGTVKCPKDTTEGTSTSTATTEFEFTESFGECKEGGAKVVWDMNGCDFDSRLVLGSSPPTGITDIVCPAGKEIMITGTILGCVVDIPPQTGIKHIVWENGGKGKTRDRIAKITEEGMKYTETKGCLFPGTYSNGVFFETLTSKGVNKKGEQEGIWVE